MSHAHNMVTVDHRLNKESLHFLGGRKRIHDHIRIWMLHSGFNIQPLDFLRLKLFKSVPTSASMEYGNSAIC